MTWKTITAHIDIGSEAGRRAAFVYSLASNFGAEVRFITAAQPDSDLNTKPQSGLGEQSTMMDLQAIQEKQRQLKAKAQEHRPNSVEFNWTSEIANPTAVMLNRICGCDVAIIFPPEPWQSFDERRTIDVGRFLVSAGRPVFLPSALMRPCSGEVVLIAWKNTKEARHAVKDAFPLLVKARDVVVLSVAEEGEKDGSVEDVIRCLIAHGIPARLMSEWRPTLTDGATITTVARSIGADVIVAGAYGHGRIREWLFGGVTRWLLEDNSFNRLFSN